MVGLHVFEYGDPMGTKEMFNNGVMAINDEGNIHPYLGV
jgi:hypothetical protein